MMQMQDFDGIEHAVGELIAIHGRQPGELGFGIHSYNFDLFVKRCRRTRAFRSDYVTFGDVTSHHASMIELGAEVADRAKVAPQELVSWTLRPVGPNTEVAWIIAQAYVLEKLSLYRSHYVELPETIRGWFECTEYLERGIDPMATFGAMRKESESKLKIPDDLYLEEVRVALHLNAGIAIAREHPEFLSRSRDALDEFLSGDENTTAKTPADKLKEYDDVFEACAIWANHFRPDLSHLFE